MELMRLEQLTLLVFRHLNNSIPGRAMDTDTHQ